MNLPEEFKTRMMTLLGKAEALKLLSSIENKDAVKAFRLNKIKTDAHKFESTEVQIDRRKADFPPDAYITREEFPGSLSCHHSGAIYMQDISAMSTVYAAKYFEGAYVLDSCSAPGGKTTQLSALVGDRGVVVANEYDRKRSRILQGNVERMGAKNTVVCNLDTAVLAETYPNTFDIVLCDAPCSGEGMFRKNERAIEEWSEENVKMCAERQREILTNVAKCVKGGGQLLYSTCTFSVEENEENVAWFLDAHADFQLKRTENGLIERSNDGICLENCEYDMTLCRRIYPHRSFGEGQFIALFTRKEKNSDRTAENHGGKKDKKRDKDSIIKSSREDQVSLEAARKFLRDNLICEPDGELKILGDLIYITPNIKLPSYNVISAGVCVGECQKGRIIPHHQLFSAYGQNFKLKILLSGSSAEANSYLKGEEISTAGVTESYDGRTSGWASVIIDGCAVGGAKISSDMAKNHYPKGLRNH